MEEMEMTDIRIYVACLAAYNNGKLHGAWIDANQDEDAILEEVQTMLKASPEPMAEEWAIHDFEGFYPYSLSEHESFEDVSAMAKLIAEHGEIAGYVLDNFGGNIEESKNALENCYRGQHTEAAHFAQEDFEESGIEIPDALKYYIDWESKAQDMEINGEIFTIEVRYGEVHVFINE
jgi:antirestriction protein